MSTKNNDQVLAIDLRENLKKIMQKEIQKVPEYIEALNDPKEKLNFFCKMMPYIFPKVEAVTLTKGEPINFDIGIF